MMDIWYDLTIRELSDLTDPAREMLDEAEEGAEAPESDLPGDDARTESNESPAPPPA
jgi:hypothetical protein